MTGVSQSRENIQKICDVGESLRNKWPDTPFTYVYWLQTKTYNVVRPFSPRLRLSEHCDEVVPWH